ncbi:phage baseplate assembly protein V [Aeromonas aquatica]|uniref:phage baseplate assembly protein V n=1 Tax=Aeromonas aquatica TaxID=558964 RepID=UPI000AB35281|nr:phage baseplate assembly protein V [Aeromonas aquatica]
MERLERLERALEQMVVRGTVEQVDHHNYRVRVRYGPDSVSDWIEWKPSRSGQVTIWSPPQVGEGVTVISNGDVNQGEAFIGSYHNAMPAPASDPDSTVMQWPDGTVITYNMATHKLSVVVAGDVDADITGSVNIKATGAAKVESGASVSVKAKGPAKIESAATCEIVAAKAVILKGAGVTMDGGGGGTIGSDGGKVSLCGGGSGVVTGAHICAYTGKPHGDCSSKVFAAK